MGLDNQGTGSDEFPILRKPSSDSATSSPPSLEEEKEELTRVLNYPGISRSANLVRFLSFICSKYFDGEAEEIRERTVAIEALGRREASFDSHADPIVRVTARELRKKLAEFYENGGKNHSVQIVLPIGRYIPQFVRIDHAANIAADSTNAEQDPAEKHSGDCPSVASTHAIEEQQTVVGQGSTRTRSSSVYKYAGIGVSLALVFLAGFFLGRQRSVSSASSGTESVQWGDPIWGDNFDGSAQQLPDSSKWTYDVGNQNGWGNHELETYCSPKGDNPKDCDPRHPNAFLDGSGHLVLRAEKNANGVWTSARITTRGLKDFQYGRIEARMKLPVGTGLWPSLWMLGSDFPTVGWPAAGSVDLVENVSTAPHADGLGPSTIRSTLHGPRYSGGNGLWRDFKLANGARVDDGSFHTYGIIWSPSMIQFYVDDPSNIFFVQYASDIPQGGEWVFDRPFFLVMNLAVGGDWPGGPDRTTPNPAEVLVDYVRVYKIPNVPAPGIQWEPVQVKAGSAAASILKLHAKSSAGRVYLSCSTEPATAVCSLATSVIDFSDNLSQEDSLTLSTDSVSEKGRLVAPPGKYKLTITATTISGNRSQLTQSFEVTGGG